MGVQTNGLEALARQRLQGTHGKMYGLVLRRMHILDCYRGWNKALEEQEQQVRAHSIGSRWQAALKIKRLVSVEKGEWLEHSLQSPPSQISMRFALQCEPELLESVVVTRCLTETKDLKSKIAACERRLMGEMDWLTRSVCRVAGWVLSSRYAQNAEFLVESLDDPSLGVHLGCIKGITAAGLLGMDLLQWRWTGLSFIIPDAMAETLAPSHDSVITLFQKLHIGDDKTAVRYVHAIHRCLQWSLLIGFSVYWESRSIAEIALAYGVAIGISQCVGKCVDAYYRVKFGSKPCSTYPLVRGVAQIASFLLAATYAVPRILEIWDAPSPSHSESESRMACGVLGVSDTASPEIARAAYRRLVRIQHPDHGGNRSAFQQLLQAKTLCLQVLYSVKTPS